MYIKNRVLFYFSLAAICFGLVWGFWPPVTEVLLGTPFTRVGFVLTTGAILLLWGIGMKTPDFSHGKLFAFEIAIPIVAVLNLITTIEQETPLLMALLLNAMMLMVCGFGLFLLFGVGYGSRPQAQTRFRQTTSPF